MNPENRTHPDFEIPRAFYDGNMHVLPFRLGSDFRAKREALLADGFFVAFDPADNVLKAFKAMAGDPTPETTIYHCEKTE